MVKIEGSLKLKKQVADIVSEVVTDFKENFKNVDLQQIKTDYNYLKYLIKSIDEKCNNQLSRGFRKQVNKADILLDIITIIFDINEQERNLILDIINVLIKKQSFLRKILKCAL